MALFSRRDAEELKRSIKLLSDGSTLGDLFSSLFPRETLDELCSSIVGKSKDLGLENRGIYIDRGEITLEESKESDVLVVSSDSEDDDDERCYTVICKFCSTMVCEDDLSVYPNMKRCSGCSKVWYCSVRCQDKDWILHKAYCDNEEGGK